MVVCSLSLQIFSITSMSDFCESKTPYIFGCKSVSDKVLMRLVSSPGKGNNCFGIEEDGDIASDAQGWFELVSGM